MHIFFETAAKSVWQFLFESATHQLDQPTARSQRLPGCRHGHPSPTSATTPIHPLEALAKYTDIVKIGEKLTDANSEPDIGYITTHPGALGADEQLAIPKSEMCNIPNRFVKCVYPVLRASITLSFSTLVLSPLSFSIWEGPKWGMSSCSTFSLTHSAGDVNDQCDDMVSLVFTLSNFWSNFPTKDVGRVFPQDKNLCLDHGGCVGKQRKNPSHVFVNVPVNIIMQT